MLYSFHHHALKMGGSAVALSLAMVAPAMAQDVADHASASEYEQGGLTEIVVTARKRAESVQDVPVAVTAISADLIIKQDLTSIEKIAARTPNLTVGRASNGSGAQLTMRGIGSSSTSIGIEQSVAVVVDGVYYGQGRTINEGFFDLGGVEILKGPQALFFGKNATAGVISLSSADPTSTPEYKMRAGYEFNAQQVQLEGVASGPLSDTLGLRIAVRGSKMYEGYYRNISEPILYPTLDAADGAVGTSISHPATRDQPGEKELLGRVTLKWEPDDRLTATLKASGTYNKTNNNSWNYVAYQCPTGKSQLNGYSCMRDFVNHQNNIPLEFAAQTPYAKKDGNLYNRYKSWAVTANINYEMDDITLTSVSNYNWNNNRWSCACDFQSSENGNWATENTSYDAISSEFRALTTFDSPINLMVGALYQKTKRDFDQYIILGGAINSDAAPENKYLATRKNSFTKGETIAAFAQATWKIIPTVEVAGGVRYTHETKNSFFAQPYNNPNLTTIFRPHDDPDGLGVVTADQTFNDWSPEATITWKPSRELLVYGAYKTAYKSGGFSNGGINSKFSSTPYEDLTFNPEKARGFEAGVKSTLLDNQLRLNLGIYSYKYNDLQVDFFNSPIFAFQTLTADARTKGVELEFEYAPRSAPGLNLHGGINYNRARYTNFPDAPCYAGQSQAEGCNVLVGGAYRQDLKGQTLSVAPEWTGTLGFSYDVSMGNGMLLGFNTDARYSGSYLATGFGNRASEQKSYVSLDAGIRFGSEDERWQIGLIGKNLTNRFYVSGGVDGPSTGGGSGGLTSAHADQLGFGNLPRTVVLQLTSKF